MSAKETRKLARQIVTGADQFVTLSRLAGRVVAGADQFVTLTRPEVAEALGISLDVLDRLHKRNAGPPRFRLSPQRWAYPVSALREWQKAKLAEQTNGNSA